MGPSSCPPHYQLGTGGSDCGAEMVGCEQVSADDGRRRVIVGFRQFRQWGVPFSHTRDDTAHLDGPVLTAIARAPVTMCDATGDGPVTVHRHPSFYLVSQPEMATVTMVTIPPPTCLVTLIP